MPSVLYTLLTLCYAPFVMREIATGSRDELGLAHVPFAKARAHLTDLFNEVVDDARPAIVARQGDDSWVVMVSQDNLREMPGVYRFDARLKADGVKAHPRPSLDWLERFCFQSA